MISLRELQKIYRKWLKEEVEKILIQVGLEEVTGIKATKIYHYDIHKKELIAISELETEESKNKWHLDCANHLVENLTKNKTKNLQSRQDITIITFSKYDEEV